MLLQLNEGFSASKMSFNAGPRGTGQTRPRRQGPLGKSQSSFPSPGLINEVGYPGVPKDMNDRQPTPNASRRKCVPRVEKILKQGGTLLGNRCYFRDNRIMEDFMRGVLLWLVGINPPSQSLFFCTFLMSFNSVRYYPGAHTFHSGFLGSRRLELYRHGNTTAQSKGLVRFCCPTSHSP